MLQPDVYVGSLVSVVSEVHVAIHIHLPSHSRLASSAHVDFVHGLSWHPTEPFLVTCGWDGQVLQHAVDISSSKGITLYHALECNNCCNCE